MRRLCACECGTEMPLSYPSRAKFIKEHANFDFRAHDSGYRGYTEGELVTMTGAGGHVGVQLKQGFPRARTEAGQRKTQGGRWTYDPARWTEIICMTCKEKKTIYARALRHTKRGPFCSKKCENLEAPGCKAAVIQALKYHFKLATCEIAAIMKVRSQHVSAFTAVQPVVVSWFERKYQAEAIAAAQAILSARGEA